MQAPGTPHSVVTSDVALVSRVLFWTAEYLARSIKCVRLGFACELESSEDISLEDYQHLRMIVENLNEGEFVINSERRLRLR